MTEDKRAAARSELYQAIGLSQAQFANPDGDGLDSAALIAAIDAFETTIREALAPDARVAELEAENAWLKRLIAEAPAAYERIKAALEAPAPTEGVE